MVLYARARKYGRIKTDQNRWFYIYYLCQRKDVVFYLCLPVGLYARYITQKVMNGFRIFRRNFLEVGAVAQGTID